MRIKISFTCPTYFFLVFLLTLPFASKAFSQSSLDSIDATIKISVCGNFLAEGGEDCDNDDLAGETCQSLGFSGGTLACDIACDFDTSGCFTLASPSPSPSPAIVSLSSPTPSPVILSASPGPDELAPALSPVQEEELPRGDLIRRDLPRRVLPLVVSFFDADASGKIEVGEVFEAVKAWVAKWHSGKEEVDTCDLNEDERCDLTDFSVLLYYVESE